MGRREQAREEAAFLRGDVGVDGKATQDEEQDVAELEKGKAREQLLRGRTWLGREFLTWLLWTSEGGEPLLQVGKESLTVLFVGRVVLRGFHGDVVELSAKGALAPYSEQVRRALDAGLLVHGARLQLGLGERSFEASVDAEFLDIRSAKLPALLAEEEDDRQAERLDLAEQLSELVEALVRRFLEVRTARSWNTSVVPALKAWMRVEAPPTGRTRALAERVKAAR